MQHGNSEFSHRQGLALLLALTAVVAAPLAVPSPATAAPSLVSSQSSLAPALGSSVETPADAALRTTMTMAGVALGAVVLVGLWWYLIARHRRRD